MSQLPISAWTSSSGGKGRRALDAVLYATVFGFALTVQARAAGVPTGPSVVAGQASVSSPSSTSTVVTQSSEKAIINWQSFSIASGSSVQFVQPNSSAIALNRVVGPSASEIFGDLTANGQVWIINGNGILFGHGSQINVGGLIATTADIQNGDFLQGNYNFSSASANPNAGVVNQGTIRAANGGSVTLAGPTVSNTGLINASLGSVVLGGAQTFTVDFTGDNLLRFAIDTPIASAPAGAQSALVSNSGVISAQGGQITLTARAARNIVDNVISSTGVIDASSATVKGGEVILDGGDGGVSVSGSVSVLGSQGGSISVNGGSVNLTGATLNATGTQGGGNITVGSSAAQSVTVDSSSTLDASAKASGNGGSILVDSQSTQFHGTANANGGAQSGNGGNIETSGYWLDVSGAAISTLAPHGTTGNWTLDPYNVTISDASTSTDTLSSGTFTPSGDNSVINVGDLETALASTNVTVTTGSAGSQTGDITVLSPLTWSSATTLTLDAYHSVNFDAAVTIAGAGGLTLKTNDGGSGGDIYFSGGNVEFTDLVSGVPQGSLTINGNSYTLLGTMAAVQAINGNLTGDYALAVPLDASTTSGWVPIGTDGAGNVQNGGAGFTGAFEGLGNTISNLTVNTGSNSYAGLFGYSDGTVRDIGLLGGSTTGGDDVGPLVGYNHGIVSGSWATGDADGENYVGGLVGYSNGTELVLTNGVYDIVYIAQIDNSYATGSVNGVSGVGGLIGENWGLISQSHATGDVTGTGLGVGGLAGATFANSAIDESYATGATSGSDYVGGLVGVVGAASVSDSYATGAVRGSNLVGGLVGWVESNSTVNTSFSTGAVSGSSGVGGLIGENDATVLDSYWDIGTSGQQTSSGGSGMTTADFQNGTLPTGFVTTSPSGSSTWSTASGLYPYLTWQYPSGTPQAISGTAYSDAGVTTLASNASGAVTVSALVDGANLGSATTGANGYYYVLVAPGTLSGTQQVLTYLNGNAVTANTYVQSADGDITNADLYGGYLRILSGANSDTAMFSGLSTALGSNTGSDFLYASGNLVSGTSLDIESTNANGLAIDTALNVGNATLILDAAGPVTQSAAISAANLDLLGESGSFTLTDSSNSIGTLAADTGTVSVSDATSMTIGSVNATDGVSSSGSVTLAATGNVTVASGATVTAGSDDNIVLSATEDFINSEGSDALNASGDGRWLVYSSAPGSDTFGDLDSANTAIWGATLATLPPGSVGQSGDRYLFAYQPTLTVTTTSDSKTYGTDDTEAVAGDYTISGLQTGVANAFLGDADEDVFSGTPSVTSAGSAASASVSNSPYAITASAGSMSVLDGYALAFASIGQLTIGKATLTIDATSDTKTYDGTDSSSATPTYSGLASVDTGDLTGLTETFSSPNVLGTNGSTLNVTAYTLTDPGNYNVVLNSATGTINKATLTIDATSDTKTYDGTNSSSAAPTYSGLAASDAGDLTGLTQAFDSPNVMGTNGSTLTVTNYSLTDPGNYNVVENSATGTINKATLTIDATTDTKTYDGTDTSSATPTYSGLVASDSGDLTGLTEAYASPNVMGTNGSTLNVTGYSLTDAGNYNVVENSAAGTINKATLTIDATTDTKTYDSTDASSAAPTYSGLVAADAGDLTNLTQAYASPNVMGTNGSTLNVAGYSLTDPGNYNVVENSALGTINKATLTVTGTTVSDKIYDGTTTATLEDGSLSGVFEGDSVTLNQSGNFASVDVGSEIAVTAADGLSGAQSGNYMLVEPTGLSANITPKMLTETLTGSVAKVYDGTTDAVIAAGNYGALSGIVGSDNVSLASLPTVGTYGTSAVGTGILVTVTGLTLTGSKAMDYYISGVATGDIGVIENAPPANPPVTVPIIYISQPPPDSPPPIIIPPNPGGVWVGPPPDDGTGPLEMLAGGDQGLENPESQFTAELLSHSLDGSGGTGDVFLIPGLLRQDNSKSQKPVGVPPTDQTILNWGNAALWY